MSKFILEIEWDLKPALKHGLGRLVGPFDTRAEAEDWARLNIPNGSWNVAPLARPYAEVSR